MIGGKLCSCDFSRGGRGHPKLISLSRSLQCLFAMERFLCVLARVCGTQTYSDPAQLILPNVLSEFVIYSNIAVR